VPSDESSNSGGVMPSSSPPFDAGWSEIDAMPARNRFESDVALITNVDFHMVYNRGDALSGER
jgi:hypothetical protein